jgi:hypothetical protein
MLAAKVVYPFLNTAFLSSLAVTMVMIFAIIPFGKRRPAGKPLSWGESMVASVYVYFVCFMAYGVVPHQWLTHAGNELGWRTDKFFWGPGGILKPRSAGGWNPITLQYAAIQDVVAVLIYAVFLGLHVFMWMWWQNRHKSKKGAGELVTSTFGRPLVKKS